MWDGEGPAVQGLPLRSTRGEQPHHLTVTPVVDQNTSACPTTPNTCSTLMGHRRSAVELWALNTRCSKIHLHYSTWTRPTPPAWSAKLGVARPCWRSQLPLSVQPAGPGSITATWCPSIHIQKFPTNTGCLLSVSMRTQKKLLAWTRTQIRLFSTSLRVPAMGWSALLTWMAGSFPV